MGSYATLYIGAYDVGSTKNDIDPVIMILFRAEDRVEEDLPQEDDGYPLRHVSYRAKASDIRDRLQLMGFTRDACRAAVSLALHRKRATIEEYARGSHGYLWQEEMVLYRELTPDIWFETLKHIHAAGLRPSIIHDAHENQSPLMQRMLRVDHDEWFGCPAYDVRIVISAFLDIVDGDTEVMYDLTDLAGGGWVDSEAELVEYAESALTSEIARAQRVVVLTEGATDKWILEAALALLRPQLADYFRFMDFEGARVAGGAGALAGMVKAFVGAGIANRIVAVFDNDTAAAEALRALARVPLPPNFAVVRLPDMPFLADYPTIGPTGIVHANVNGLAASIEVYLGRDVLTSTEGSLSPVHWRGYNDALSCYQGEVLDKEAIHRRFRAKVAAARDDSSSIAAQDWEGLEAVIISLTGALAKTAEAEILAFEGTEPP